MEQDALWYEAAMAVGITNAHNVVADALAPNDALAGLIPPVEEAEPTAEVEKVFGDIRQFYQRSDVPICFRLVAHDPGYLADIWEATRHAFSDHNLSRRLKEALAFAVSVTSRSSFGTAFHLEEMRRLGVSEAGYQGGPRRNPDVLQLHQNRRRAATRTRHGTHRACGHIACAKWVAH